MSKQMKQVEWQSPIDLLTRQQIGHPPVPFGFSSRWPSLVIACLVRPQESVLFHRAERVRQFSLFFLLVEDVVIVTRWALESGEMGGSCGERR